ncbi:hypothetical protein LEP1GSC017_3982 [Leptospira meyeri serovar Hardjo str. Went 5]|uniref:hypothetical protein n=1 Tax=Leptospira meyeri TaxID=29508 RepID=UPI00028EAE7A|nr:hypothetical protein [Leptospira meyeri]EKJ86131.1 hypothetical protein LEP1GSC017_3982 [Leptospira meyeri serovar Hardjo str. Went 5]
MFKNVNQYILENKITELIEDYKLEKFKDTLTVSLPYVNKFFKDASDTHYIKDMLLSNGTYNILILGEIGYILYTLEKNITKEIHKTLLKNEKFKQTFNELHIFYFLLKAEGNPKFINRTHRNSPDITVSIPNLDEMTIEVKTIGISKRNIERSEVSNLISNNLIQYADKKNLNKIHFESSRFLREMMSTEMVKRILVDKKHYTESLNQILNKHEILPKTGFIKIPFIGTLHFETNDKPSSGSRGSISGLQFDSYDDYKKILENGIKKASLQLEGYPNPFCIVFTNSRNNIIYSKYYSKTLSKNFSGILFIEGYFDVQPQIRAEFLAFKLTKETRFMRKFAAYLPEKNNQILLHCD